MAFDKRKALQNALTYTQQGKWDRAIAEYQAIVKADPRDLTVCNNLGDLYARVGKPAEAIEQYLKLGELFRTDGLSVKAIAVYKKIVKLDPNRAAAYLACADLYQEQGLVGEAKVQLATVAEQYAKAGDTAKVIEVYQRLAQMDPANHLLLSKLADFMVKQGMLEEASAEYGRAAQAAQAAGLEAESRRLFKKAREALPDSPEANLGLAELQLQERKYAEAVEALTKVTTAETENGRAWRLMGEAYAGLGQADEAIRALQQAVTLGIPEAEVGRLLAVALAGAGRTDETMALCQRMTEDALSRGDADAAMDLCKEVLAAAPALAPMHAHLVGVLQQLGRQEEARSALWALASAHETNGETEAAIHVYHQLLESDPADTEARSRLEVLEAITAPPAPPEELLLPTGEEEPLLLEAPTEAPGAPTPAFTLPTEAVEPDLFLETSEAGPPPARELVESLPTVDLGGALEVEGISGLEIEAASPFAPAETEALGGMSFPAEEPAAGSGEYTLAGQGAAIDFLGEGMAGLGELGAEEGPSGEVAEKLAEAEVYLKYGLADKARDRLLEVVRLAPENLTAHRQLKAMYLDRHQASEVCGEILIIARILEGRQQREAALQEIQEGLTLQPGHAELQGLLAEVRRGPLAPAAEVPPSPRRIAPVGAATVELPEPMAVPEEASLAAAPAGWGLGFPPPEEPPSPETPGLDIPTLEVPADLSALEEPVPEPVPAMDAGPASVSLGDEELPPELRALLEESSDEQALVLEGGDAEPDQAMADDLAEGEFYLSQGMVEEAQAVHRRMQARNPEHPAVTKLAAQLAFSRPAAPPEPLGVPMTPPVQEVAPHPAPAAAQPAEPSVAFRLEDLPIWELPEVTELPPDQEGRPAYPLPGEAAAEAPIPRAAAVPVSEATPPVPDVVPRFTVADSGGKAETGGFVNLGAELEQELAAEEQATSAPGGGPLIDGLLKEFQKGVREHLDEKDFETHYNLGIAYKEMELYDEAIQEFRLTGQDPKRSLLCADLLGLCYLAMGQPDQAIQELTAGLSIGGQSHEGYHPLRYDLGAAYEAKGDLARALEQYEILQAEDPRFRDVRAKVQALRERVPGRKSAPAPPPALQPGASPRQASNKKISFI